LKSWALNIFSGYASAQTLGDFQFLRKIGYFASVFAEMNVSQSDKRVFLQKEKISSLYGCRALKRGISEVPLAHSKCSII